MTTNNAAPESDKAAKLASADSRAANTVCMVATPEIPSTGTPDITQADGLAEIEELLKKLNNPELISIRRLFNMC